MNRFLLPMIATLAAAVGGASTVRADDPLPSDAPGWTGVTHIEDLILARQALMLEIERLMRPLDEFTVGEPADPDDLRSAATTISQMLLAVPHLFPPTTNLYDETSDTPITIALPAIWDSFDTFYTLAGAAADSATALSSMQSDDEIIQGSLNLRASCDACHALFLRPYVASKVTSEDRNFDFDAFFGTDEDSGDSDSQ
jgi:cytochrome c556